MGICLRFSNNECYSPEYKSDYSPSHELLDADSITRLLVAEHTNVDVLPANVTKDNTSNDDLIFIRNA